MSSSKVDRSILILSKTINCLLFIIFFGLFFTPQEIGLCVALATNITIFCIYPKLFKMLLNRGFLIFVFIILSGPLLIDFSLLQLLQNLFILARGLILIFLTFIIFNDFSSCSIYFSLRKYFPGELINIIQLSLNLLPQITETLKVRWQNLRNTRLSAWNTLVLLFEIFVISAEELSSKLSQLNSKNIIIISGEKHQGKSTLAFNLAKELINKNFTISGFITKSYNKNGKRDRYDIVNLNTDEYKTLARIDKPDSYIANIGPYYFSEDGFQFAKTSIDFQNSDIVFMDEIGLLEANQKGFYSDLKELLESNITNIAIVVRKDFIETIENTFNFKHKEILYVTNNYSESIEKLISVINSSKLSLN